MRRWQQSGQTVREFCRSAEVKESAFYWWRQRLARRRVKRGEDRQTQTGVPQRKETELRTTSAGLVRHEAARFLPVEVVMDRASGASSGVEIHWGNGRRVRLDRGFDRQTLADVLAVPRNDPCGCALRRFPSDLVTS